ncbi:protein SMAX1-LIKE 3-like [Cornus florida]|uniref:protein SMAX1-LIKE 3-like n=1 Tax=Cornus florida TaxID=4283 RepID=UPI00289CF06D|nr:protein SMAX1-LIKE 3-like [Cornus florida]
MRTGGYTTHHSLTSEAASIVTQAISLAKRQGHAQVTPLHVARAMLASSTGLLRKACLQSHSHPLQCKALELCFNVALNRLPTSASSNILGHHSHHPPLSNALVAAFKRAQAHQRRGSIENQQQPILALKVEIEQLIISILDDPSVSRVMREAGFSSPQVKTNVEQAVSLEICSQSPVNSQSNDISTKSPSFGTNFSQFPPMTQFRPSLSKPTDHQVSSDDVKSVLNTFMSTKRKNTVIVGECLASVEGVVRGVMDKFKKGDVPGDLRYVQVITLPVFSFKNLSKEVVEQKLGELWSSVKSYGSRGVVLYVGDLKWVSEFRSNFGEQRKNYYCPVELMIMELSRMLSAIGDSGRLWILGIATFQTYMKCKTGHSSLESLWQLHPLTVPVGTLGLSLNLESDGSCWSLLKNEVEQQMTCCTDCSANFRREAQSIATTTHNHESTTTSTSSSLPSWLQQYKEEKRRENINDQESNKIRDLSKKWNSICSSFHKNPHFLEKDFNFPSSIPCLSNSISSADQCKPNLHHTLLSWPAIFEPNRSPKEHQFLASNEKGDEGFEPNLKMYMPFTNEPKPDLLSNPNSSPNSASSSEAMEDMECLHQFKELNYENLKILCNALEEKVPWQVNIIPEIASTVLECRSGKKSRKGKLKQTEDKEETWLFFSGVDSEGKDKIARELAKLVFGSHTNFVTVGLSCFSMTRADSTEECVSNKRAREELGSSYLERFAEAVQENPSRVFFMEDLEQVDYFSQMGVKKAIESGRITLPGGELVLLKDAIVIFSCESFSSMSRACSPPTRRKTGDNEVKEVDDQGMERRECVSLDLNTATEEDDNGDEHSVGEIGILELVDKQIIFKILVL